MAGRLLRNRDVKGLFNKDFIKEGKAVDDDDDNNGGNLIGCGCSQ